MQIEKEKKENKHYQTDTYCNTLFDNDIGNRSKIISLLALPYKLKIYVR